MKTKRRLQANYFKENTVEKNTTLFSQNGDRFMTYLRGKYKNLDDLFNKWNIDDIEDDYEKWKMPIRWLCVYILANDCPSFATHTHVGCVSEMYKRIQQHNGIIQGGPSETKRAVGHWKLMLYLELPPYRNYSSSEIILECEAGRGWLSRCSKAIEIAIHNGLEFKVSSQMMTEKSPYYSDKIKGRIEKYISENRLTLRHMILENFSDINVSREPNVARKKRKRKDGNQQNNQVPPGNENASNTNANTNANTETNAGNASKNAKRKKEMSNESHVMESNKRRRIENTSVGSEEMGNMGQMV